jgi:AcrR family transcriptional regulator
MAEAVAERGYGATTIAGVVRAARVSKSTFYAHFAGKEECYVALYSAATDNVLDAMRDADAQVAERGAGAHERLTAVNRAYLETLAGGGGLTRSLLIEVQTAGTAALAMRRDVLDRFAHLMSGICDDLRRADPGVAAVSAELALAAVGGVNEIVMRHIEQERIEDLPALTGVATDLWCALLYRDA